MKDVEYALEILNTELCRQTGILIGSKYDPENDKFYLQNISLLESAISKIEKLI
jgi:hypothetical protein